MMTTSKNYTQTPQIELIEPRVERLGASVQSIDCVKCLAHTIISRIKTLWHWLFMRTYKYVYQ